MCLGPVPQELWLPSAGYKCELCSGEATVSNCSSLFCSLGENRLAFWFLILCTAPPVKQWHLRRQQLWEPGGQWQWQHREWWQRWALISGMARIKDKTSNLPLPLSHCLSSLEHSAWCQKLGKNPPSFCSCSHELSYRFPLSLGPFFHVWSLCIAEGLFLLQGVGQEPQLQCNVIPQT